MHTDFRGPHGAYDAGDLIKGTTTITDRDDDFDLGALNFLGQSLEQLARDPKYADWLFVFGSVIAYADKGADDGASGDRYSYWNFAPVYKGGPNGKAKASCSPSTYTEEARRLLRPCTPH